MADSSPHIGTLKEAPLHAAIKEWYRRDGDLIEVPLDGFVIDLVRDDLLVEIQTKGFSAMKRKLTALLHSGHRVRIVYPIAVDKWIVKVDADGAPISRRRSPKHGGPIDLFSELVSFPRLINEAGLELEALLTTQEERRAHTPGKSWRRQGWSVVERSLVDVVSSVRVETRDDLLVLLPDDLPDEFVTSDLAEALGRPRRVAQQVAYCLREAGAITVVGKRGNAIVYRH